MRRPTPLVLAVVLALAGCGKEPAPAPPPATTSDKLPPEVEFDPATAAAMKSKPRR
jgi:hypothetical protein